jgi:very-short-patch-repair endonuclease
VGSDWQKSTGHQWKSASERDRRALALGRNQKQLATAAQLAQAGFSPGALKHRVETGRLFRLHSGVYSLNPPPFSQDQWLMGATLAGGDGSVVSDRAAGWLLGLTSEFPAVIELTSPSGAGRSRTGITIHRRVLEPRDRTCRRGIPCTTGPRTVVDLAGVIDVVELERILLLASSRGLIDKQRLEQLVIAHQGRPGASNLRAVLGWGIPFVRSPIEVLYIQICREAGVEEPLVNQPVVVGNRTFEVDFQWPTLGIIVEVDGYAFHGGRSRANADRDRDQCLGIAGWNVHRFTRDQIVEDRADVGRRTLGLIDQAKLNGRKSLRVSGNLPLNPGVRRQRRG